MPSRRVSSRSTSASQGQGQSTGTARRRRDPLRAQRVDARRSQILDAAVHVFASKGFHRATIRDIAKRAKLADGTIYLYFKNKGDLVLAILNRINDSELRAVELGRGLAANVDVRTFFSDYLRQRIGVLRSRLDDLQAVLPDILRDPTLRRRYLREVLAPTQKIAEPVIASWVAEGKLRSLDPRLSLRVVPGLFLGLLVLRMLGDVEIDALWDALPDQVSTLLFDGMTPAGAATATAPVADTRRAKATPPARGRAPRRSAS